MSKVRATSSLVREPCRINLLAGNGVGVGFAVGGGVGFGVGRGVGRGDDVAVADGVGVSGADAVGGGTVGDALQAGEHGDAGA
jgi:hypothetical protein